MNNDKKLYLIATLASIGVLATGLVISNPSGVGDEVMDAVLSKDFNILMLETSVIPNSITKTLDFTVIKRS